MSLEDKALVAKVAKDRGEDISSFVRRAIKSELARLSFLSADEKKALGVKPEIVVRRGHQKEKGAG